MRHYAGNVVFSSPLVIERKADPRGVIRGTAALRDYFSEGLRTTWKQPCFELLDILHGVNGYTVYYAREGGLVVNETVILDDTLRAVDVRVCLRKRTELPADETRVDQEARLMYVIAKARFEDYVQRFVFKPLSYGMAPEMGALACVSDDGVWSQLVPAPEADAAGAEYRMFSFRFDEAVSAKGFIAWLSAHLYRTVGTGVVVICGKDARGGEALYRASQGVFDYWACPFSLGAAVRKEIDMLRNGGMRP